MIYLKQHYCNILFHHLSIYNYRESRGGRSVGTKNSNDRLVLKKRGEDGSRIITVRIKEDTLTALDQLAAESNYSRNELINIILKHGIKNIIIE